MCFGVFLCLSPLLWLLWQHVHLKPRTCLQPLPPAPKDREGRKPQPHQQRRQRVAADWGNVTQPIKETVAAASPQTHFFPTAAQLHRAKCPKLGYTSKSEPSIVEAIQERAVLCLRFNHHGRLVIQWPGPGRPGFDPHFLCLRRWARSWCIAGLLAGLHMSRTNGLQELFFKRAFCISLRPDKKVRQLSQRAIVAFCKRLRTNTWMLLWTAQLPKRWPWLLPAPHICCGALLSWVSRGLHGRKQYQNQPTGTGRIVLTSRWSQETGQQSLLRNPGTSSRCDCLQAVCFHHGPLVLLSPVASQTCQDVLRPTWRRGIICNQRGGVRRRHSIDAALNPGENRAPYATRHDVWPVKGDSYGQDKAREDKRREDKTDCRSELPGGTW